MKRPSPVQLISCALLAVIIIGILFWHPIRTSCAAFIWRNGDHDGEIQMCAALWLEHEIIGISRERLIQMLGPGSPNWKNNTMQEGNREWISFYAHGGSHGIGVTLQDGKVIIAGTFD